MILYLLVLVHVWFRTVAAGSVLGALPWDRPQLTRSSNPHLEIMCQHLPPPNIALKGKSKCNLAFLQRALTYWQMRHSVRARIEMHFGRISSFFLLLYLDHCSCTALKDTESLQRKQCTWLQSFTLCFALHCSALTSLVTGFPQCDYRDGLHQSTRARLQTQGHQQRSTLNEQLCRPKFYSLHPDSN